MAEGKPGFFAIASAPGSDPSSVELLIKSQPGSASEGIAALAVGSALMVSAAQGKGFPLEKIPLEDVDMILMVRGGSPSVSSPQLSMHACGPSLFPTSSSNLMSWLGN